MADGNAMQVSRLSQCQPRRFKGYHFGCHIAGQMSANRIECQRRSVSGQRLEFAVRNQSQLNQSLESIAYAKYETISSMQQRFHRFFQLAVSEQCGDKLAGSIRFITS